MTSNIGKSNCHVGCHNSEGKPIKPTISNLSQNTPLRRLRATLNFSWQAPEGILQGGFFNWSGLKMTKSQPLKEFSELVLPKKRLRMKKV